MRAITALLASVTLLAASAGRGRADSSQPYRGDLQHLAKQNADFQRVLFTTDHVQIVLMTIPANEDIGPEAYPSDQCFFFVEGGGTSMVDARVTAVKENDVLCVPAGVRSNVRNPGIVPLKLYTLFSPPRLPAGTVLHTKQDALEAQRTHHDRRRRRVAACPCAGWSTTARPGAAGSPASGPPRPSREPPHAPDRGSVAPVIRFRAYSAV